MKISIIIPIYNVRDYIIECLDSVANQKCKSEIECLLIDDCGTDDSMVLVSEWITDYHGDFSFQVIHHDHNRGLSAARNTGMDAATGDYIFFLDSDDLIKENCISCFEAFINDHPSMDVVVCGIELIGGTESDLPRIKESLPEIVRGQDIMKSLSRFDWFVLAQSKFYSRTFIEDNKISFLEGIIHEDNLWTFHIATKASTLGVIKKPCYLYRIREGSIMTSTKAIKRVNSMVEIIAHIQKSINNDYENKEAKRNYMLQLLYVALAIGRQNLAEIEFKDVYSRVRMVVKWNLYTTVSTYGFDVRQLVRNLHFSLPDWIGYKVYCGYQRVKGKRL